MAGESINLKSRRELWLLACALGLALAVRLAYVLATRHYRLAGDQIEYDLEGQFIAQGKLFWTSLPYGIPHPGAWKAPGYPAWVGFWYALLGHHPLAARLVQVPVSVVTVALGWLLGRRLFGPRVALATAFLLAVYPLAWQYDGLLYSESLATPLTVGLLVLMLGRAPSTRRAAAFGALLGLALLVRPTSEFLLLGALVAWGLAAGWRRGLRLTLLAAALAVLVVVPWTIRNEIVLHGFVPISMQDSAAYGTFNPTSASDPVWPYAWRADPPMVADLYRHPLPDVKLRADLTHRALSYIQAHPLSVPSAFFWNGLSRLWDVRHRSRAVAEVRFEGRSRLVSELGLYCYYLLAPLCLLGLWRARRRRALAWAVLAMALGASIVFTVDSGTRYRAPLEPLIAVLACAGALGAGGAARPLPGATASVEPAREPALT
jgi:4-amino-4-deoxy-L-arabinose transferase-like glycosyltransferase